MARSFEVAFLKDLRWGARVELKESEKRVRRRADDRRGSRLRSDDCTRSLFPRSPFSQKHECYPKCEGVSKRSFCFVGEGV